MFKEPPTDSATNYQVDFKTILSISSPSDRQTKRLSAGFEKQAEPGLIAQKDEIIADAAATAAQVGQITTKPLESQRG